MAKLIFDTETTGLDKPFCYNAGYIIVNDEGAIVVKKEYVCEQVWHNPMLFTTAYYANKRPIYVNRMRARQITMKKFGYICQEMIRDIERYNVTMAFAFNSDFDEKVFDFNCEWFKCNNPFDNVEIKDIRGFVHHFLIDNEFKAFCEEHELFTECGNYSTTAETMYRYITDDNTFEEEHTALSDSIIEWEVLKKCIERGADTTENYKAYRSIKRDTEKVLTIDNKGDMYTIPCKEYKVYKSKNKIVIK